MICVFNCRINRSANGRAKLEEIITTGFPPYNYEQFSDNKLRTQWFSHLELRLKYWRVLEAPKIHFFHGH